MMFQQIRSGGLSASKVFGSFLVMCLGLRAQSGLELEETVFEGATVFVDGKLIEDCDLVFAGSRVKRIGVDAPRSESARIIDAKDRFIIPALIDAGSSLGLRPSRFRGQARAFQRIEDAIDIYGASEVFGDALAHGLGYAYLRNAPTAGVGGQGLALRLPDGQASTLEGLPLESSQALHLKVGTQNGPLARLAELQRMRGDLVAAKKYAEAWEKYEKDLEKYEKDLAEWAKKNAGKKKPDTASKSDKKEATATPPQNDPRRRTPRRRTRSFEEFFGVPLDPSDDGPWLPRLEDDSAVGSAEAMHPMQRFVEAAHRGEGHEPFSVPTSPPQLRREPTLPGSGINPHLRPEETIDPFDLSRLQIPICADCGGVIEGAYGDHQHEQGWDFWQFAPEEEKKDEPKDAAAAKTATRPGTADKSGGQPKKPAQPKYDPHAEVVGLALKGKLGVRIEVHRAEDILNVLALIEEYPMRAVLEGVTEGYRVADRIAKSGLPVVLRPRPIDPPAQASASGGGFPGLPFPFPAGFPMPRRGASRQSSTTPLEGEAHFDNAARLHAAGVKVAFGSLDDSPETSASLLSLAAWAAGHGMPRDAALSAVTAESAAVLGQDRIGSLSRGKQASFVVMTGHPFEATSQVERVYLDGKRVYKN